MVKFLINRPIAVVMAFLAFVIIGVVTFKSIPVTLLPAVDIPKITIRVAADNTSARQLENVAVAHLRRQLQQVAGLREIQSETRDGSATIRLDFDYGVDTDLAYIAVNEKIDAAMGYFPKGISRPKAIKASATDIPVLYLSMTLKGDESDEEFLKMAEIAGNSVKRRIEQMPEVAFVDVTGVPSRIMRVTPNAEKTEASGITSGMIENALTAANMSPGSMTVREGYYEYNVNVTNRLRTAGDVADINIRIGDRVVRLGDIADIAIVEKTPQGMSDYGGKRAVTLAVIKQNEENADGLRDALASTIVEMEDEYPGIEFSVSRNQTELLDYSISNLGQNLVLGLILVFFVTVVFMGDFRTAFVTGISIVTALVLTFLLFYLCHVSLNVVSLSGLILAVGMMIDNSVIVTENITQWRQRGLTLSDSCCRGTEEMISPLLSSSLTTVAVFLPLVFMSGIAGAIFADQAFSITVGLAMSYATGILLLPVLYRVFFSGKKSKGESMVAVRGERKSDKVLIHVYNSIVDRVFAHRYLWLSAMACAIPLCYFLFKTMPVERMPDIPQSDVMAKIEWNENITAHENSRRVRKLTGKTENLAVEHSALVGVQDFMLDDGTDLSRSDAEMYFRCASPEAAKMLTEKIDRILKNEFPEAAVEFYPPGNIFEKVFSSTEPDLVFRLVNRDAAISSDPLQFGAVRERIECELGKTTKSAETRRQTDIVADGKLMAIYNVDPADVSEALRTAFSGKEITTLQSLSEYIPVAVIPEEKNLEKTLSESMVKTGRGAGLNMSGQGEIPLSRIVSVRKSEDFREIFAGKNGEYLPLSYAEAPDAEERVEKVKHLLKDTDGWETELSGAFFSNSDMMREMIVILLVSVVLMYFILCAQFESFLQPLIVLLEIPIDTAFALLILKLTGNTLNIMSAIGIIVTCGIVVNDSILKLDAINTLRRQGVPLLRAIHTAGVRRLRPILMTSLTTIFAMIPVLFTNDLGSSLQRPLAVAMIGSMVVGTLVSIFIIPLIYYTIYNRYVKKNS